MAAFLCDNILDQGIKYLDDHGSRLDICSALPASYAEATTDGNKSLGYKSGIAISAPGDRTPDGRKVTISAITDGTVTDTDTATHWAITDGVSELLAANTLAGGGQAVTDGNTFTLTAFDVGIPDPT